MWTMYVEMLGIRNSWDSILIIRFDCTFLLRTSAWSIEIEFITTKKCRYKGTDTLKLIYHCCSIDISAIISREAFTHVALSAIKVSPGKIYFIDSASLYSHATTGQGLCWLQGNISKWKVATGRGTTGHKPAPHPMCTRTDVA